MAGKKHKATGLTESKPAATGFQLAKSDGKQCKKLVLDGNRHKPPCMTQFLGGRTIRHQADSSQWTQASQPDTGKVEGLGTVKATVTLDVGK